ncbi:MAG TPA: hypothetical protein VJY31_16345 [Buttiauxella sp.]|nr:hypothetical protein [Buttiauxella sp.]
MHHNDFLITQIKRQLIVSSKCDESEANAAVALAMEYRRIHPNAGVQAVIDKAKFYLKHNHRPAAPPRMEPIKKGTLPKRRQFC